MMWWDNNWKQNCAVNLTFAHILSIFLFHVTWSFIKKPNGLTQFDNDDLRGIVLDYLFAERNIIWKAEARGMILEEHQIEPQKNQIQDYQSQQIASLPIDMSLNISLAWSTESNALLKSNSTRKEVMSLSKWSKYTIRYIHHFFKAKLRRMKIYIATRKLIIDKYFCPLLIKTKIIWFLIAISQALERTGSTLTID